MHKKMSNNLNKYKIKIKKFDLNSNNLRIESYDGNIFMTSIKKGSIQCKIFNESKQEVNLSSLEENSLVTIIGLIINDSTISNNNKIYNYLINDLENNYKEKNIIVIRKIIVKNNYVFNSDSSYEFD
jgi:hypothetical protein